MLMSAESFSRLHTASENKYVCDESERELADVSCLFLAEEEGEMRQDPRLERLSVTWCFVIVAVVVGDDAPVLVVASRRSKSADSLARLVRKCAMQGGGASETAQQIVEFEELVSRLDRINDVVIQLPTTTRTRTRTSTSVPPPARASLHLVSAATSLPYDCPVADATRSPICDEEQRVRVHIGIDEDLRMILEMDPSIVDGTLEPSLPDSYPTVARSLRATRPQGWYCTDRD